MKGDLEEFSTSDLALAAFLKISGVRIKEWNKKQGKRAEIVFKNVNRDLVRQFNEAQALVEPIDFSSAMRQLTQIARRVTSDQ